MKKAPKIPLSGPRVLIVPDDFWGLSLIEVKKIVKRHPGCVLSNKQMEYDGSHDRFNVTGLGGQFKIKAPSDKKFRAIKTSIADARRNQEEDKAVHRSIFDPLPKKRRRLVLDGEPTEDQLKKGNFIVPHHYEEEE